tara:strand:- start:1247 stop:1657 length:411 start_codon:yes stop_codon:yes gene_type:complete
MKIIKLILVLFTLNLQTSSDTPTWIDDDEFEDTVSGASAFGDDDDSIIIVEFWADFNKDNSFDEWNKLIGVKYYRIDIANAPVSKKKYRVRMTPTLIVFKNGEKQAIFKAGLDLLLPANLQEIQETIDEINTASSF